jgi:hypothetical protein
MWEIKTRSGEVLDRVWNQTSLAQVVERSKVFATLLREKDLICVRCPDEAARITDFVQWIESPSLDQEDIELALEKELEIQRETFERWGEI